jgi:uncharacterized protein (TIGR00251 family)
MPAPWAWQGSDLLLRIRVRPRARKDLWQGVEGERLQLRLAAPPIEGQANLRLVAFLAETFGVAKSHVLIEAGASAKDKRVRVRGPRRLPPDIPPA